MSFITFVVAFLILFVVLNVFFAITMNVVFMANRKPLVWILLAAVGGLGLSWLTLRLGASPSAVTTAFAAFAVAKLWKARAPAGVDPEMMRSIKRDAWDLAGMPHGSLYTWVGIAAMVTAGVAATIQTCDASGACRPLL